MRAREGVVRGGPGPASSSYSKSGGSTTHRKFQLPPEPYSGMSPSFLAEVHAEVGHHRVDDAEALPNWKRSRSPGSAPQRGVHRVAHLGGDGLGEAATGSTPRPRRPWPGPGPSRPCPSRTPRACRSRCARSSPRPGTRRPFTIPPASTASLQQRHAAAAVLACTRSVSSTCGSSKRRSGLSLPYLRHRLVVGHAREGARELDAQHAPSTARTIEPLDDVEDVVLRRRSSSRRRSG